MDQEVANQNTERGAGHAELLEEFARFLKYSFTYPSNNKRVLAHLEVCLQLLSVLRPSGGEGVAIAVNGDDFYVDRQLVVERTVHTSWLREAFLKTALGGVKVAPDVAAASLHSFAQMLRENFSRPGGSFNEQWFVPIVCVEPIELRFTGRFAGIDGAEDASVKGAEWLGSGEGFSHMLLENESLVARLEALQAQLSKRLPNRDDTVQVNILDPICKALPAEALMDPRLACDLVERILDACGERILAVVEEGGITDRDILDNVVADVGRKFFKSHLKNPEKWDPAKLPEGRPEDERIHDDLETMLAEFAALPSATGIELHTDQESNTREMFGVFLYEMLRPVKEQVALRAANRLRALLDAQGALIGLLEPYVEACFPAPEVAADPVEPTGTTGVQERSSVRERLIAQARLAAQTQPGAQWSSAENRAPDSSGAPAVAAVATDAGSALAAQNGGPEWRIVEFLVQGGWTQLLAKYDWRAPEAMGRAFPRLFGLCLDALNRGTPAEDRQLAAICRRVGERRILAAGGFLVENEGILDEPRLRRIVAVHDDAMLPLVRIIAERGPVSVRKFVAGRLRKRDLPVAELAALQGVYPASDLSNGYLIALCAMEPTAAERRWLIEESGRLLRRFLNESAGNEELTERRIFAINLLRVLPSQETLALLRTIRNENSRLALSRAKQALRKAASEAYDQMVDQV